MFCAISGLPKAWLPYESRLRPSATTHVCRWLRRITCLTVNFGTSRHVNMFATDHGHVWCAAYLLHCLNHTSDRSHVAYQLVGGSTRAQTPSCSAMYTVVLFCRAVSECKVDNGGSAVVWNVVNAVTALRLVRNAENAAYSNLSSNHQGDDERLFRIGERCSQTAATQIDHRIIGLVNESWDWPTLAGDPLAGYATLFRL